MHARPTGWLRCKTARTALLWMAAGVAAGSATLPQRALAMSVETMPALSEVDAGFSIVFEIDSVDNVLRVTLPKSGAGSDLLTLSHPLDRLEQVVVDLLPDRGVRVSFDSGPLGSADTGHGSGGTVPEPASAALLALGLLGACARGGRRGDGAGQETTPPTPG